MNFKRIESRDISVSLMQKLVDFCVDYIERSGDSLIMPMQLVNIAQESAFKKAANFQFWLLSDENGACGYALTEFQQGLKGPELFIRQAYIGEGHRNNGVQVLTTNEMEKFARESGCKFLVSGTQRTPFDAYLRWMGRVGFKPRSVDVEKPLLG